MYEQQWTNLEVVFPKHCYQQKVQLRETAFISDFPSLAGVLIISSHYSLTVSNPILKWSTQVLGARSYHSPNFHWQEHNLYTHNYTHMYCWQKYQGNFCTRMLVIYSDISNYEQICKCSRYMYINHLNIHVLLGVKLTIKVTLIKSTPNMCLSSRSGSSLWYTCRGFFL